MLQKRTNQFSVVLNKPILNKFQFSAPLLNFSALSLIMSFLWINSVQLLLVTLYSGIIFSHMIILVLCHLVCTDLICVFVSECHPTDLLPPDLRWPHPPGLLHKQQLVPSLGGTCKHSYTLICGVNRLLINHLPIFIWIPRRTDEVKRVNEPIRERWGSFLKCLKSPGRFQATLCSSASRCLIAEQNLSFERWEINKVFFKKQFPS